MIPFRKNIRLIALSAIILSAAWGARAAPLTRPVTVEALPEYAFYRPGSPLRVAFDFHLEKGWHTFWINPGKRGECAQVEWKLPEGWRAEGLEFPAPRRFGNGEDTVFGYNGDVVLLDTLVPSMDATDEVVTVQARVFWQAAQSECVTEETRFSLSFRRVGKAPVRPLRADRFRLWQDRIPRGDPTLRPALRRPWLAKGWSLEIPGTRGEARPEFFPITRQGVDASKPLKGRFDDGVWKIELPPDPASPIRGKTLEGVMDPGPNGGAPLWLSVRIP